MIDGTYTYEELHEIPQLIPYLQTIYNKSVNIQKNIDIYPALQKDCFELAMATNLVFDYDDAVVYVIILDNSYKFVEGVIYFNGIEWSTKDHNKFLWKVKKFVNWSNNFYGLTSNMIKEIGDVNNG